jgi:hypothetical protein
VRFYSGIAPRSEVAFDSAVGLPVSALAGHSMLEAQKVRLGYLVPLVTSWRDLKNLVYAHVEAFVTCSVRIGAATGGVGRGLVLAGGCRGNGDRSC